MSNKGLGLAGDLGVSSEEQTCERGLLGIY